MRLSRLVQNILSVYARATQEQREQGAGWFAVAHLHARLMAQRFGITTAQAAAILAAFSPATAWDANLAHAWAFLRGEQPPTLRMNIRKAQAIFDGADPEAVLRTDRSSGKVWAFFCNIIEPTSSDLVTIDRHAFDAALGVKFIGNNRPFSDMRNGNVYALMSKAYKLAGEQVGLLGNQMQGIVWWVWREGSP